VLIHLDTSVLVDAFTGPRRSLSRVRSATASGDVIGFSTIVLYEWLRGPRRDEEVRAVTTFFDVDGTQVFGRLEAELAAGWYRRVKRARQRQGDLAIAACAVAAGAALWTLNRADFSDIPDLTFYSG
jgi:predicted nucleic acid-binding protein